MTNLGKDHTPDQRISADLPRAGFERWNLRQTPVGPDDAASRAPIPGLAHAMREIGSDHTEFERVPSTPPVDLLAALAEIEPKPGSDRITLADLHDLAEGKRDGVLVGAPDAGLLAVLDGTGGTGRIRLDPEASHLDPDLRAEFRDIPPPPPLGWLDGLPPLWAWGWAVAAVEGVLLILSWGW